MVERTVQNALAEVQKNLKVSKSQFNAFGKYKYRSCEDIVEAVKKVMPDDCTINLSDEMVLIGDRYYIKATAIFSCGEKSLSVSGYAREPLSKKGMDESQITGTASSYARKYALNGLFAIDDTKDADTQDNSQSHLETKKNKIITKIKELTDNFTDQASLDDLIAYLGIKSSKDILNSKDESFLDSIIVRLKDR